VGLKFVSYTYSTADVPGRWALVLFLPYCNFRCRHCHNWPIVLGKEEATLTEDSVLREIKGNPILQTLVLSGGEPTLHDPLHLREFILKVKEINPDLSVRIDTNGYEPETVEYLRDVVDGFAVDIKAPLSDPTLYSYTTGREVNTDRILRSVKLADGMPLTLFRTVKYPWLKEEEREKIREFTQILSSPWTLNEFIEVPECPFNLR